MIEAINNFLVKQLQIRESFLTANNSRLFLNGKSISFENEVVNLLGEQTIDGTKTFENINVKSGVLKVNGLNTELKILTNANEEIKINWDENILQANGLATVDWGDRVLRSGDSILDLTISLDWNNKILNGRWKASYPQDKEDIATKEYVDDCRTIIQEKIVTDYNRIHGYIQLDHEPEDILSVIVAGGTAQFGSGDNPDFYIDRSFQPPRLIWKRTWGDNKTWGLDGIIEEGDKIIIFYNRKIT
jgi:hypothetical protein